VCDKEICHTLQFQNFKTQAGEMMTRTIGRKSRKMLFKKKRWEAGRKESRLSLDNILNDRLLKKELVENTPPENIPLENIPLEKKKPAKKTTAGKKTVKKKKESDK
jgi:hypothetical protein